MLVSIPVVAAILLVGSIIHDHAAVNKTAVEPDDCLKGMSAIYDDCGLSLQSGGDQIVVNFEGAVNLCRADEESYISAMECGLNSADCGKLAECFNDHSITAISTQAKGACNAIIGLNQLCGLANLPYGSVSETIAACLNKEGLAVCAAGCWEGAFNSCTDFRQCFNAEC